MKKVMILMLALGLCVPVNAVNRRPMRRRVMRRAPVQRKLLMGMDKEALTKNAIFFGIGVAITAVIAVIIAKKRENEAFEGGFHAGRALRNVPLNDDAETEAPPFPEPVMTGRVHTDEPLDLYPTAHRNLDEPADEIPLETTGTHRSVDNPFDNPFVD